MTKISPRPGLRISIIDHPYWANQSWLITHKRNREPINAHSNVIDCYITLLCRNPILRWPIQQKTMPKSRFQMKITCGSMATSTTGSSSNSALGRSLEKSANAVINNRSHLTDLLFSQNLQSIEFFSRKRQMILFSFVTYAKCVNSIRHEVSLNDVALCTVSMCCKVMSDVRS